VKKISSSFWGELGLLMDYKVQQSLTRNIDTQVLRVRRGRRDFKVELKANVTYELIDYIEQYDGEILFKSTQFHSILAMISSELMENLSKREDIFSISTPAIPIKNSINVSGGVIAHRVNQLKSLYPNIDGTGIKIGVLSDSVNYLSQVQSSGDLPNVTVLDDLPNGTGEGTAMLEIVHDMAPGAELYFATALHSDASFAQNILRLVNEGCKVIVDDIFYLNEPAFEDGIIAQAVNQAASQGVAYFSSAGNVGNLYSSRGQTWEGDYRGSGSGTVVNGYGYLDYHMFSTTPYNKIYGQPTYVSLQWSDPYNLPDSDFDLFIINSSGQVVAASTGYAQAQEGTQIPAGSGLSIVVARYYGPPKFIRVIIYGTGALQYFTKGSTSGHSTAVGAFGVGAVPQPPNSMSFVDMNLYGLVINPESFSADGPRKIYFENGIAVTPGNFLSTGGKLRAKPDFVAVDGVSTATPGFNPFFGTSAAAPHAAGLAALALSASNIDLLTLRSILTLSTIDVATPGVDEVSGAGFRCSDDFPKS